MCGISGIVKFSGEERVDRVQLDRMRDSMWHRGPDDAGTTTLGRVGLSHRRLSIIDIEGGHQPMSNESGTVWITYNGEIYNYRALRSKLQGLGCVFRTQSDTEVILRAYETFGEKFVHRLKGMFAFAIWDANRETLVLARDRLGIKPLYYYVDDEQLLFGSEIKSILASGEVCPKLERSVVPEFLATRYVSGARTFFVGINKLLPGCMLTWSARQGISETRYWRLPAQGEASRLSFDEHARQVREGLCQVVRSHLVSDVPVGLFLSGGIDSSALAAFMSRESKEPIKTFSVAFEERSANELSYARLVAKAVGSEHHDVVVSPDEFFELLPSMVWHEDEPIAFTSSIPLHVVSRLAAQHVKVVLTGEGADELFLGYNKYRVTAWNYRLSRAYSLVTSRRMREQIARWVPELPGDLGRIGSRTFLARDADDRSLFCENFSVFPHAMQRDLLKDKALAGLDPHCETLRFLEEAGADPLGRMGYMDMHTHLVELLMKQDQMSMAASIESRVPFLDHEFVESAMAVPDAHKVRGWRTKAVLREALADIVPNAVLTRKKMGFPVPVDAWMRGPFKAVVDEFVLSPRSLARGLFRPEGVRRLAEEHAQGTANHGERLWLLANLEIWQRVFIDQEMPPAVCMRSPAPGQQSAKAA